MHRPQVHRYIRFLKHPREYRNIGVTIADTEIILDIHFASWKGKSQMYPPSHPTLRYESFLMRASPWMTEPQPSWRHRVGDMGSEGWGKGVGAAAWPQARLSSPTARWPGVARRPAFGSRSEPHCLADPLPPPPTHPHP